ncbi:MAG: deoxyribodipyrimidine photo-lyase, partial [Candidatus Promineifilaceae bacterium]|nr:deoxyribodipyrimidine photo-lyase [Candidatus Promineifilaceae bacterium]
MTTSVWWIRRDLRLADNQALAAATRFGEQVVPAYILDPALLESPYVGEKRLSFLFANLRELDGELRQHGSRLVVRKGNPQVELAGLLSEVKADAIFAEEDISPYAHRRDAAVRRELPLRLCAGVMVHPPGTVLKQDGEPYIVFTPYKRTWLSRPRPSRAEVLAPPSTIVTPEALSSDPIPETRLPREFAFPPGERAARRRLAEFVGSKSLIDYEDRRNRTDLDGTSRLSPYLRFGLISAREALVSAYERRAEVQELEEPTTGIDSWINQLIWREFYMTVLHFFPDVLAGNFRSEYDNLAWREDPDALEAWQQGRTGYPMVDAAMRQMNQTGWMHNRGRMIVASFLVKDLLIDWRLGERYFMTQLIDG